MMAIGPIGNAIYVNQQSLSVANTQANQNSRVDFQNMVAATLANEKDEKVIEVRPTEENQGVDSDREHQKEQADQESKRSQKKEEDAQEENTTSLYKIDIKV